MLKGEGTRAKLAQTSMATQGPHRRDMSLSLESHPCFIIVIVVY